LLVKSNKKIFIFVGEPKTMTLMALPLDRPYLKRYLLHAMVTFSLIKKFVKYYDFFSLLYCCL